jgi:serine/threonine-protein kinase
MGIVHRDVSPNNMMVSYDGQVKLLDFGVAKAATHTTKTQAGVIKGKFSYMAPEQCTGEAVDARGDVFALGICFYELLTGFPLYRRATEYETMRAVVEEPAPSIRDRKPTLPIELDRILQKALAKKPDDRYRTAREMQEALEDWLAGTGRAVTPARIGDLMRTVFESEILAGPRLDSSLSGSSFVSHDDAPTAAPRGAVISPVGASSVEYQNDDTERTGGSDVGAANRDNAAIVVSKRRSWVVYTAGFFTLGILFAIVAALQANDPITEAPVATVQGAVQHNIEVTDIGTTNVDITESATPESGGAQTAPREGRLRVHVEPSTATVQIGNRTVSSEQLRGEVSFPPGTYPVHVEHPGYRPWDGQVVIEAGNTAVLEPTLVPSERAHTAPRGRISINTRPWSKVYVGSRLLGTTPIGEASVPSGRVRLRIVDRDGRTFSRTVHIDPGERESVFFDLGR